MGTLNSQQATELGDYFWKIGDEISNYFIQNFDRLTAEERTTLSTQMTDIWGKSSSMYTLSAILVLDDLDASLQKIRDIKTDIDGTLKNLSNVQKAIDITGAAVGLAAALLSKDPQVIGSSIEGLAGKIAKVKNDV